MHRITMLSILGISVTSAIGAPLQWNEVEGGNNHWYEAVQLTDEISWTDAKADAESRDGYLVTLTRAEESLWVGENIIAPLHPQPRHGPWIGLFQDVDSPDYSEPAGGWTWVNSEALSYTDWDSFRPEPNDDAGREHFASISTIDFEWNDVPNFTGGGSGVFAYIIEYENLPPCAADLAPPFGVLDLMDVNVFVGAFILSNPIADLAEPYGLLDLSDIVAFIDAFNAGCGQ